MEASAQGAKRDLDAPLLMVGSVRGLAMLGVFAMHAAAFAFFIGYAWGGNDIMLEAGRAGVAVFFVLAGFLLYLPFAMARLSGGPPPALLAYYVRRGLRIIPAYWVALVIYALYFDWDYVFTAEGVVTYFGFVQVYDAQSLGRGITPAWAVDVLVSFYLLLPLWSRMMRAVPAPDMRAFARTEAATIAALVVASLAWKVLAYRLTDMTQGGALPGDPLLVVLPAFMDYFAFGMAFAVAFLAVSASGAGSRALAVIRRAPGIPVLAAAAIFCAIVAFDPWLEPRVLRGYDDILLFLAHVLTGVAAVALLLAAAFGSPRRGVVTRVLANRALLWFGVVSYGFFLWHGAMLGELHKQFPTIPSLPWVAGALALSLAAGALSYYLIERPLLRFGKGLPRQAAATPTPTRGWVPRTVPVLAPALAAIALALALALPIAPYDTPAEVLAQRAALVTRDGHLHVKTSSGLARVVPGAVPGAVERVASCGRSPVAVGRTRRPADRVLLFGDDRVLAWDRPRRRSRFLLAASAQRAQGLGDGVRLRVFAVRGRRASELQVPAGQGKAPDKLDLVRSAAGLGISSRAGITAVRPGAVGGVIEDMAGEGLALTLRGWAAHAADRRPAECVIAFANGALLAAAPPDRPGPGDERSGFALRVPPDRVRDVADWRWVRVFAASGGVATELPRSATAMAQQRAQRRRGD